MRKIYNLFLIAMLPFLLTEYASCEEESKSVVQSLESSTDWNCGHLVLAKACELCGYRFI